MVTKAVRQIAKIDHQFMALCFTYHVSWGQVLTTFGTMTPDRRLEFALQLNKIPLFVVFVHIKGDVFGLTIALGVGQV